MLSTPEVLKELRRLGLSQVEISRRTAIPQSRISRWEAGQVPEALEGDRALRLLLEATTVVANTNGTEGAPPVPSPTQPQQAEVAHG